MSASGGGHLSSHAADGCVSSCPSLSFPLRLPPCWHGVTEPGCAPGVPAGPGLCHPRRWHRLRRLCRPCWGRARRGDGGWGPKALGGQASLRNVCEKARDVGKGGRELAPAVNSLSSSVPLREGDIRQGPRRLGVRVGSSVGAKVHGAHHQPISTSPFQG